MGDSQQDQSLEEKKDEDKIVVNQGKSTFSARLVALTMEELSEEIIQILNDLTEIFEAKKDSLTAIEPLKPDALPRLLGRPVAVRDLIKANQFEQASQEWVFWDYDSRHIGFPPDIRDDFEAKNNEAILLMRELGRRQQGPSQHTLEENALELRKHCEIMWRALQENNINNWWGINHAIDYIDARDYKSAADSMLSMYGGMGSFSDVWIDSYSGPGDFYDSQSKAHILSVEIQLKIAVAKRRGESVGSSEEIES